MQDGSAGTGRGGSVLMTKTCAGAELLFARCATSAPMSQTFAAEYFKSKAEVLFARLHSFRFRSRSFCCRRLCSNGGWVLQTVLFPVIGVVGAPLARAVAAPFAVLGIGGDLFLVVVRTPPPLAIRFIPNRLARLELRWLVQLPAVAATPLTHRAFSSGQTTGSAGL